MQEQEAGANFTSLSQSRNMVWWFMKSYFHKPIKILQFFITEKMQKMFNIISRYFIILNNAPPSSCVIHI